MIDDAYGKPKLDSFKRRPHNQLDNGKRKRQNPYPSQDGKAGNPEVIETLYRILCPVKKIGSVLGKGGEIVNALRDETHAKIRVSDAIPGAEERVVIIFSYPSKQSEKVDGDRGSKDDNVAENKSDEMRPHCPAQDALLRVHDRIAADEYLRGGVVHKKTDPDDTVTGRILVPSYQVGCLLGKGGTVIEKLRSDYKGANIRVLPSENLLPCAMSSDELVQVSGPPTVVKRALYDISTRLHQHPHKENPSIDDLTYTNTQGSLQTGALMPPRPPIWSDRQCDTYPTQPPPWFGGYRNGASAYGPSSYSSTYIGNEGDTPEEFSMRIVCPTGKIGGIIGKAGANIRQLEHDTLARIQVEDTLPDGEERIISVTSREGPWDQISPTIEAILQLQLRTSATTEDGAITTRILVPSSKVGCLLGQGGNIIIEMRRRIRANIRVYLKDDKPSYTSANEELVQISGNPDVAREALLEIASRLRARTFRNGSASVNPASVIPDGGFTPAEIMPARGLPSSHRIGAIENPAPEYPVRGFTPHENISSRGPLSFSLGREDTTFGYEYTKRPEPVYATQGYPPVPPPGAARTVEIKIPSNAMHSVLGAGGSNITDIRQTSGAWVKLHDPLPGSAECVVEIHGTSEQLKTAQSLLQAFMATGGPNVTQPLPPSAMHAPFYHQY